MGMGDDQKKCAEINVFCGDGHGHKKQKECCDPCKGMDHESSYVATSSSGAISPVATEIPLELLVNPMGSGKKIIVYKRSMSTLGSDDHAVLFRYYFDPQLTSQGTLQSSVNLNSGSLNVSVSQFYSSPIVITNGSAIDAFNTGVVPFESDAKLILAEGHSLLVTGRANAEGVNGASILYFSECKVEVEEQPAG